MDREKIHGMYVESIRKSKRCEPFPGIVPAWGYAHEDFVSAEGLECYISILLGSEEHDGKAWPKGRCLIRITNRAYYADQRKYYQETIVIPETEDVFDVLNEAIKKAEENLPADSAYLADMEAAELRAIFTPQTIEKKPNRL